MTRRIRTFRRPSLTLHGVEPTRVLAVGNGQKFIEEISTLLSTEERIELLGGAQYRSEAAARLVLLKPDVVVDRCERGLRAGRHRHRFCA
jgi:hypothetical protein